MRTINDHTIFVTYPEVCEIVLQYLKKHHNAPDKEPSIIWGAEGENPKTIKFIWKSEVNSPGAIIKDVHK